ncbi:hypothetical protein LTR62_006082 [Meristemomyces frigidus]|uniref:Dipeptidyl peptidase 3 n=1 Tax=Meristemomyces frigidus TaxID=1508187 RepID=A0AAN7TEX5_9PEZI|nr:hypothetical protein LTR62_006082 [Meristemomyces frigidus]
MDAPTRQQYLADDPPTVVPLAIRPHFEALDERAKKYAHYLSRASFAGTRVNLRQVSPESEGIYDFILVLHKSCGGDWQALGQKAGLSSNDLKHFLSYAAQFLGNTGNYKSFGDSKFIPRLPADKVAALAATDSEAQKLYEGFKDELYESHSTAHMHLGYPDQGHVSTYYPDSPSITHAEIELVSSFLGEHDLMPENTRLRKMESGDYEVLIASAITNPEHTDAKKTDWTLSNGKKLRLIYGDHQTEMSKIATNISSAKDYALNSEELEMHAQYFQAFHSGSMHAHKESQRHWVRDIGPLVECNIGFIETYRDPHGIRGEWEGFVAMINQERTKAFAKLVESAPEQIPKLPWGKEFEKDKFLAPDFTSLEVLSFAGSGIPAGINIPNYDSIRQNEGFKNVSLGNVLSAAEPTKESTPFILDADQDLFNGYKDRAFELQVGLHELLGHGCGKLLQETAPGEFNFDHHNPPISPVTGKPVSTYYKPGETWGSVFGGLGPSYEECRAECVAMSLCPDYGILQIFGFGDGSEEQGLGSEAGKVLHACYLSMARAGVTALQFWDPGSRKWGQPHMRARFAILKIFLSAPDNFCTLQSQNNTDLSDLKIHLDASKIASHGRPAVNAFLQKLQIYKATADFEAGRQLYEEYTEVGEWYAEKLRPVVLKLAKPRKVFVQANTFLEGNGDEEKVVLREYDASPEGMVQSFVHREYI